MDEFRQSVPIQKHRHIETAQAGFFGMRRLFHIELFFPWNYKSFGPSDRNSILKTLL